MAAGLKYGLRHGYWILVGLLLGVLTQFALVIMGLGAILATSELAFSAVKWVGAVYLVYLGWQQIRTNAAPITLQPAALDDFRPRDLIIRGWLVNVTNPKGTVFILAVIPQFLNPSAPLGLQYAIIAVTMCITDTVAMACYTGLAARMLRALRKPSSIRWMNRSFGALFILAGTALATVSQR